MAREIKYRAWDIEYGRWILPKDINIWGDGDIWLERRAKDDGDVIDTIVADNGKAIIEQFTGLHDRTGKEIYEGDVIKYYYYNREDDYGEGQDVVVYSDCAFNVSPNHNKQIEVIGNIHENPELVNKGAL